jgi:4-cresol dehydrogenase (hydroxylating) flavoprotein subunit
VFTNSTDQRFILELQKCVDAKDLRIEEVRANNTLGIQHTISGTISPRTIEQVQKILQLAVTYRVAVYPVSKGKNIGYGNETPYQPNQWVLNLSHLNGIREVDLENGEAVVEPGVTQEQLATYLRDNKIPYWADVTGASPEASLVGNTLEAGFGHTPIGDHRKHILNMEVVLADGSILQTGEMPSVGPDLAQLFVQSNFGVVTAIRIPLFPIPEKCITFALSFNSDAQFFAGITKLKELRKSGVLNSLVHSGNSTRTLMTASKFPKESDPSFVLSEAECMAILNNGSFLKTGAWNSVGAIYGFDAEVNDKIKRLKRAFRGIAKVRVFSDRKIKLIDILLNSSIFKSIRGLDFARKSFTTLKALHGILRGQPSSTPSDNIHWRTHAPEELGLAWFSPVIPATPQDAAFLLELSRDIFKKFNFEMPVTLTLINEKKMTAVFNFNFNKLVAEEVTRAHQAYKELSSSLLAFGYSSYRLGILSDAKATMGEEKARFLEAIKRALDPKNVIAPGRYGIGSQTDISQSHTPMRQTQR